MSRTITLGPEQEALLQRLLDSGRFPDEATAIGAGLELLESDQDALGGWTVEELRQAVQVGIDSGPGVPIDEAFDRIEKKLEARIAARRQA